MWNFLKVKRLVRKRIGTRKRLFFGVSSFWLETQELLPGLICPINPRMHICPCSLSIGISKKIWIQAYFGPVTVDSVEIFRHLRLIVPKNYIFWGANFELIKNLAILVPEKLQRSCETLLCYCHTLSLTVDQSWSPITSKSAYGIARTSPRLLGHPALAVFFFWVGYQKICSFFPFFCSASIPSTLDLGDVREYQFTVTEWNLIWKSIGLEQERQLFPSLWNWRCRTLFYKSSWWHFKSRCLISDHQIPENKWFNPWPWG